MLKNGWFLLLLFGSFTHAQEFKRKDFDYRKLKKNAARCSDVTLAKLDEAILAINQNNSEHALSVSQPIFDQNKNCPEIYGVHGESLFRSGKLLEGINIVDDGIEKFGSDIGLIRSRYMMSIELYEVGTGRRNIDGNAVFNAGNKLPFDEAQFKDENIRSAAKDLEYLIEKQPDSLDQVYTLGRIYQLIGEPEKAISLFEKLKKDERFRYGAVINIVNLQRRAKDYDGAIQSLESLISDFPKVEHAYGLLAEIYREKGDIEKADENTKKESFYGAIPAAANLEFSDENYRWLETFAAGSDVKEKYAKLAEIEKTKDQNFTADVCLTILKLHTNHGNGLEEKATETLTKIGKPSIEKVHQLFIDNISTCTVSNLAHIMATVKDQRSWQVLADYLPYMATMPSTVIPPDVPTQIVRFDNVRGTKEILKVVKPLLQEEQEHEHLPFAAFQFFSALKIMKQKEVLKMARELGYSDVSIKNLKSKI